MASPTRSTSASLHSPLVDQADAEVRREPPRSPPVTMNPPRRSQLDWLLEALLGSDDEGDELPPPDAADTYVQDDFALLFDTHCSKLPENPGAWLPCLPPLARALHDMSSAGQSVDVMLGRAAELSRQGMDATAIDSRYGRSVLHWACMLAHPALVPWLLREGAAAHLNRLDHQGHSPLGCLHACRRLPVGAEVIGILLSSGASLDALPHRGAELLYRHDLSVPLVRWLLQSGVDVEGVGAFEPTPLVAGCGSVNWGAASLLLDCGASVLRRGAFGTSVLHNARLPVWLAEQFLRRGADVESTDCSGKTPLMLACAAGNLPLVRWLVSRGARLDAVAKDGLSVADHAALAGPEVTAWLRRHGHRAGGAPSAIGPEPAGEC